MTRYFHGNGFVHVRSISQLALRWHRYDLDVYDEPLSTANKGEGYYDSDDEDVANDNSDDKVQQLLSKYLKEEEDEDIHNAIKGGAGNMCGISAGGASADGSEKYGK